MKTYQTNDTGVFQYEQETSTAPFGAVFISPPDVNKGMVALWGTALERVDKDYGAVGTGEWVVVPDNRASDLYLVADGQKYTVGSDVSGNVFDGLGEIPGWLTAEPRPSQFHEWQDAMWVLNEAAQNEAKAVSERAWRDAQVQSVEWLRNRHRDEVEQGIETTLSTEQYEELLAYIQALRDWPTAAGFPDTVNRPVVPAWVGQ